MRGPVSASDSAVKLTAGRVARDLKSRPVHVSVPEQCTPLSPVSCLTSRAVRTRDSTLVYIMAGLYSHDTHFSAFSRKGKEGGKRKNQIMAGNDPQPSRRPRKQNLGTGDVLSNRRPGVGDCCCC
uniref:(California timema) hypothetical protein n=1 Tax=Timema californicum TaxID=61474 RepID=A0A7R9JGB9_TIMCA|nr:unnamed protein product [Timema californicum]